MEPHKMMIYAAIGGLSIFFLSPLMPISKPSPSELKAMTPAQGMAVVLDYARKMRERCDHFVARQFSSECKLVAEADKASLDFQAKFQEQIL